MRAYPAFLVSLAFGLLASPAAADLPTRGPTRPCHCVSNPSPAPTLPAAPTMQCRTSADCPLGYSCVSGSCRRPITPGAPATPPAP